MIVVADTSPLNYLIRLGHITALGDIYGRVLVPEAVLVEMRHSDAPPEVHAWASQPPSWLEVINVKQLDPSLPPELGAGEREAISLALEMGADILLIDERVGRWEAEVRHIVVAGTLAIVLQASLLGHFLFPDILEDLRRLGFRMSRSVERAMLDRYEKAKGAV